MDIPSLSAATEILPVREAPAGNAVVLEVRPGRTHRNRTIPGTALRARSATPAAAAAVEASIARDLRLERLLDALADATEPVFRELAAALDLARYRSHVDVGGGNGRLSCILATREPRLASRSCDLPEIRVVAERRIRERGLLARVQAVSLDPYSAEFPKADLITLGHLLHDWNIRRRKLLIAKAWRALAPGGALVAIETILDPSPRREHASTGPSSGAPVEQGDSLDVAGADFMRWLGEAGFQRSETLLLPCGARAVIASR